MNGEQTITCPVCMRTDATEQERNDLKGVTRPYVTCPRCGSYTLERIVLRTGFADDFDDVRHLASAWIWRENKAGIVPHIGYERDSLKRGWATRFRHMAFPESVTEKLDALLRFLADFVGTRYTMAVTLPPNAAAAVAAKDQDEVDSLRALLGQLGYVATHSGSTCSVAARGWKRVEELRGTGSATDSGFVAMWFDNSTSAYRESVSSAILHCGYRPIIVDQEEFNGFIMDQVIALIRSARFVVADFTCDVEEDAPEAAKVKAGSRGGVYWEAGFAYALSKPVIHTCQNTDAAKRRIHFDVDQYNTIFWRPDDLRGEIRDLSDVRGERSFPEKLAARILADVGRGSYQGARPRQ